MTKMTKHEVYCTFFPEWFHKYAKSNNIDLFLAGRYCTLTMNLLLNPYKIGTDEYEVQWPNVCLFLLQINHECEQSRKKLIEDVIQYAVDEYSLKVYTSTTYLNGIEESETFYYR